jgi:hypothetical protein
MLGPVCVSSRNIRLGRVGKPKNKMTTATRKTWLLFIYKSEKPFVFRDLTFLNHIAIIIISCGLVIVYVLSLLYIFFAKTHYSPAPHTHTQIQQMALNPETC